MSPPVTPGESVWPYLEQGSRVLAFQTLSWNRSLLCASYRNTHQSCHLSGTSLHWLRPRELSEAAHAPLKGDMMINCLLPPKHGLRGRGAAGKRLLQPPMGWVALHKLQNHTRCERLLLKENFRTSLTGLLCISEITHQSTKTIAWRPVRPPQSAGTYASMSPHQCHSHPN